MEQIPHIAVLCVEHRGLHFAIPQYILPVVVRYLTDPNNQVRKTSQAALLLLLEQEVIERADVEQQICPVLIELCSIDSTDDFRTEAVTLMSKMAPMVGKEITERYFLAQFDNLCSDPLFHVRKVCASNFGEMCEVIGNELTETRLLPVFMKLCQDGVWGVRKACAECFMSVSTVACKDVRRNELAPLFINLLGDKSRWVQMAAYQSLGPFISTFSDPHISGFFVDDMGKLCKFDIPSVKTLGESSADQAVGSEREDKENSNELESGSLHTENNGIEVKTTDSGYMSPPEVHLDGDLNVSSEETETSSTMEHVIKGLDDYHVGEKSPKTEKELDLFNSFNYWRTPLPDIGVENSQPVTEKDEKQQDGEEDTSMSGESDVKENTSDSNEENSEKPQARLDFQDLGISDMDIEEDCDEVTVDDLNKEEDNLTCDEHLDSSPNRTGRLAGLPSLRFDEDYLQPYSPNMSFEEDTHSAPSPPHSPLYHQTVIPQALLDHYISMTEPSKAQAIDTELAKHCAFSFPAVTLTLGAKNWRCLRDTYELLSSDMQWKVRRTLAFSIHELSQILGEEITRVDLVPIFNNFLKDLDEVRIGVLKHLANFIKLLAPDLRSSYLPTFSEFLNTDNVRNWRFRFELAEQLIILTGLYHTSEVSDHICPIALTLGADRVAEVRLIAYKLIGILLLKLEKDEDEQRKKFTDDIIEHFATSPLWFRRLTYGQLCEVLLEEDFITAEKFAIDFLPDLLNYQSDTIVNVKLTLSRTLTRAVMVTDYFCRPECKDSEKVLEAIERLQADNDRDVRYFAGRDEEVPYEGRRRSSDDPTLLLRTTSRESPEEGQAMMGRSPLEEAFAEEQIEAKLLAVETTDDDEDETVTGVHVEGSEEKSEEKTGEESVKVEEEEQETGETEEKEPGEEQSEVESKEPEESDDVDTTLDTTITNDE